MSLHVRFVDRLVRILKGEKNADRIKRNLSGGRGRERRDLHKVNAAVKRALSDFGGIRVLADACAYERGRNPRTKSSDPICEESRAEYGGRVILELSKRLGMEYGGHYSKRNLDYYCQFYRLFADFEIVNARVHNLRWTHYRELLSVTSEDARYWYLREASREGWSARRRSLPCSTRKVVKMIERDDLVAICVQTGRMKDRLRVHMFLSSDGFDREKFESLLDKFGMAKEKTQWLQ